MKRLILIILIILLIPSFAGCGKNDIKETTSFSSEAETSEATENQESTSETESESQSESAPAPEPMDKIKNAGRPVKVLNLFSYTGAATMACSSAGAEVVQVDASKGMTEWAKENMHLCNLDNNKIRFIVDDCLKFVEREARRGNKYDGIVMDPPSYGRGPNGEVWKFEKNLYVLIEACLKILSDKPIFFLINSYTTGISSIVLENILKTTILPLYPEGSVDAGEVGLPIKRDNMVLPCGIYGRWQSND